MKYFYIFFILSTSFLACELRSRVTTPESVGRMLDNLEREKREEENLKKWDHNYLQIPLKDSLFVDFKNLSR